MDTIIICYYQLWRQNAFHNLLFLPWVCFSEKCLNFKRTMQLPKQSSLTECPFVSHLLNSQVWLLFKFCWLITDLFASYRMWSRGGLEVKLCDALSAEYTWLAQWLCSLLGQGRPQFGSAMEQDFFLFPKRSRPQGSNPRPQSRKSAGSTTGPLLQLRWNEDGLFYIQNF